MKHNRKSEPSRPAGLGSGSSPRPIFDAFEAERIAEMQSLLQAENSRLALENQTLRARLDRPPLSADAILNAGLALGRLVMQKNAAYGSSVTETGEFLRLLFPRGIPLDRYRDVGLIVRLLDKLMRIAHDGSAFGESPWQDIAGYGLLGSLSQSQVSGLKSQD